MYSTHYCCFVHTVLWVPLRNSIDNVNNKTPRKWRDIKCRFDVTVDMFIAAYVHRLNTRHCLPTICTHGSSFRIQETLYDNQSLYDQRQRRFDNSYRRLPVASVSDNLRHWAVTAVVPRVTLAYTPAVNRLLYLPLPGGCLVLSYSAQLPTRLTSASQLRQWQATIMTSRRHDVTTLWRHDVVTLNCLLMVPLFVISICTSFSVHCNIPGAGFMKHLTPDHRTLPD